MTPAALSLSENRGAPPLAVGSYQSTADVHDCRCCHCEERSDDAIPMAFTLPRSVIPAKAGIQSVPRYNLGTSKTEEWTPVFAGVKEEAGVTGKVG